MIPIGALIGAGLALRSGVSGVRGGNVRPLPPSVALVLLRTLVGLFGSLATLIVPYPYRLLFLGALALLAFPALLLRFVLVPLALPRVAYWFMRISPPVATASESKAAAVLFGALAALRSRARRPETAVWLQARIDRIHTFGPTGLAASGFLAVLGGRLGDARLLLEASDSVPSRLVPRLVRRPVQAWLVADAARNGDWHAIDAIARRGWQRWPRAMSLFARRLRNARGAPSDLVLWLAWAMAPHRYATLPILRRAVEVPRRNALSLPVPEIGPVSEEPLEAAVSLHAAFVRAPSPSTLGRAARAWDVARDAPLASSIVARRALALATEPDPALARVFALAETELAPFVDLAPEITDSLTLGAAAAAARRLDLEELETMVSALRDRTARAVVLDPAAEWMEWASLRLASERARGTGNDLERRRTVFSIVYPTLCNYGAWLFNARGQKLQANVIFRWLAAEGSGVAEEGIRALLRRNVRVGAG
jgi:hypothetical protein